MKNKINIFNNYYKIYFYNSNFKKNFIDLETKKHYEPKNLVELKEVYEIEMREYLPNKDIFVGTKNDNQVLNKIIYNNNHINSVLFNKKSTQNDFIRLSDEAFTFFYELYIYRVESLEENIAGILNLFVIYDNRIGLKESFFKLFGNRNENCFSIYLYVMKRETVKYINEFQNIKNKFHDRENYILIYLRFLTSTLHVKDDLIELNLKNINTLKKINKNLLFNNFYLDDYLYLEKIRCIITKKDSLCPEKMLIYCKYILKLNNYEDYIPKITNILSVFIKKERYTLFFKICTLLDFIVFTIYVSSKIDKKVICLKNLHAHFYILFNIDSQFIKYEININYFYNTYFLNYYRKYITEYRKINAVKKLNCNTIKNIMHHFPNKYNSAINFKIVKKCKTKNKENLFYVFSPICERILSFEKNKKDFRSKRKIKFD